MKPYVSMYGTVWNHMIPFITTQARHDCEKIAITGLEPASQDRSS